MYLKGKDGEILMIEFMISNGIKAMCKWK